MSGGFTAGGAWALRFPAPDEVKFCAIEPGAYTPGALFGSDLAVQAGATFLVD